MKRSATILSLLLAGNFILASDASAENISKHWAYENLMYAKDKGFLKGDENGNLYPDRNITRAEFAMILVNALKLQLPDEIDEDLYSIPNDVKPGDWYYDTSIVASYYGLVKGDENGNFSPTKSITREEMAAMLNRAVNHLGIESMKFTLTFLDTDKISSWAIEDVQYIVSNGLMSGRSDGTFGPRMSATRAEAVTVIKNLLEIDRDNPIKVGPTEVTIDYNTSFEAALAKQVAADPKADGSGLFTASKEAIAYYMHPGSFDSLNPYYYQFLKLTGVVNGITADKIDSTTLNNVGILSGTAEAFMEAGVKYNINFIYLISHALHETGYGKSELANGIEVGLNSIGNPEMVTETNRASLQDIRKVYNMYGVGAKDSSPKKLGSEYAYSQGWFTVKDAIIGGAEFVTSNYFKRGQDTLYKMKWNPEFPGNLQYATHIIWAVKQAEYIASIYKETGADKVTNAVFEIPNYVDQPAAPVVTPTMEQWYAVDTKNSGMTGTVTTELNIRSYPGQGTVLGKLSSEMKVTVVGENNGWYKVTAANGLSGWISGEYVKWDNNGTHLVGKSGSVTADELNVRQTPQTGKVLTSLKNGATFTILEVSNGWYKINVNGVEGWISGSYVKING